MWLVGNEVNLEKERFVCDKGKFCQFNDDVVVAYKVVNEVCSYHIALATRRQLLALRSVKALLPNSLDSGYATAVHISLRHLRRDAVLGSCALLLSPKVIYARPLLPTSASLEATNLHRA